MEERYEHKTQARIEDVVRTYELVFINTCLSPLGNFLKMYLFMLALN